MTSNCLSKMGGFKVSHVMGEKNGNPYEFYSVERSWKDQNNEWQRQNITVRPGEMLILAELLNVAAGKIIAAQVKRQNEARQGTGDAEISDDVPF